MRKRKLNFQRSAQMPPAVLNDGITSNTEIKITLRAVMNPNLLTVKGCCLNHFRDKNNKCIQIYQSRTCKKKARSAKLHSKVHSSV